MKAFLRSRTPTPNWLLFLAGALLVWNAIEGLIAL
jgi:hypothetical protein